uniref:Uncharacterized protein n=1 Tax=Plectus sambesii TaxID=2011161 RepID=A0A914WLC3_9BILA
MSKRENGKIAMAHSAQRDDNHYTGSLERMQLEGMHINLRRSEIRWQLGHRSFGPSALARGGLDENLSWTNAVMQ